MQYRQQFDHIYHRKGLVELGFVADEKMESVEIEGGTTEFDAAGNGDRPGVEGLSMMHFRFRYSIKVKNSCFQKFLKKKIIKFFCKMTGWSRRER